MTDIDIKSKTRYVVLLVLTESGKIRINKVSKKATDEINAYLNIPTGGYYIYFDFTPYGKGYAKKLLKEND